MATTLSGPFDDFYALTRGADSTGTSSGLFTSTDAELIEALLTGFLDDPLQQHRVRELLGPDYEGPWSRDALRREIARRLARGSVVFRYLPEARRIGRLPGVTVDGSGQIIDAAAEARERENLIRDWKVECHHHANGGTRPIFERETSIQVVPDKGTVVDHVKIHYKDEIEPPPPALRCAGNDVPKTGGSGGYDIYGLDARFTGDIDQSNFFGVPFWTAYLHRDVYTVTGTPSAVRVEVFNPRQYKLELKFPPLRSVKAGAKLEKDIEVDGRRLKTADKEVESWSIEDSTWSPSKLQVTKFSESSKDPPKTDPPKDAVIKAVEFNIDSVKQSVDILEFIGALLNFYTACMDIVDAIKENAPKVGWYVDFSLQLMQGGVAIEWYWKEHEDKRVFQYVDFNISVTVFAITFELGIGISGLGFRAQVFAQVSGELSIAANARRDSPDGAPGFAIPAKAFIKGALGARFEAGNLFKAEGKGETGIEVDVELGINRGRSKMVNFDAVASWTGIKVEATVSGGLFGFGREKKWERTIAQPKRLGGFEWPKPQPFAPPYLSRSAIKNVMKGVITRGFDIRVIRTVRGLFNDEYWTPDQIADALADKIDRHPSFHRTPKMVDGLAHAIRKDLDALGRRLGRDWIEEADFLRYVRGSAIPTHQNGMINPAAQIAAAAS